MVPLFLLPCRQHEPHRLHTGPRTHEHTRPPFALPLLHVCPLQARLQVELASLEYKASRLVSQAGTFCKADRDCNCGLRRRP